MKKRLTAILTLVAMAGTLTAGTVKLAWDPSITPDVEYIVYASTNTVTYENKYSASIILNAGTNLTADVSGLAPGVWNFAATSLKGGLESELSEAVAAVVGVSPPMGIVVEEVFFWMLTRNYG